jgi:hypothetical protein
MVEVLRSLVMGMALENITVNKAEIRLVSFPIPIIVQVVSRLRRRVSVFSKRRPAFNPEPIHVGFVVDELALGQVLLRVLRLSSVSIP